MQTAYSAETSAFTNKTVWCPNPKSQCPSHCGSRTVASSQTFLRRFVKCSRKCTIWYFQIMLGTVRHWPALSGTVLRSEHTLHLHYLHIANCNDIHHDWEGARIAQLAQCLGYVLDNPGFKSRKAQEIFLRAFAKLRKATISFVMSVRPSLPSVCPHGTTGLQLDGFSLNVMLEYFSKKKNCR